MDVLKDFVILFVTELLIIMKIWQQLNYPELRDGINKS